MMAARKGAIIKKTARYTARMRTVLAAFAFLVSAACYGLVALSIAGAVRVYLAGRLSERLNGDGWFLVAGWGFYALIGTIGLCLGLSLIAKPKQ